MDNTVNITITPQTLTVIGHACGDAKTGILTCAGLSAILLGAVSCWNQRGEIRLEQRNGFLKVDFLDIEDERRDIEVGFLIAQLNVMKSHGEYGKFIDFEDNYTEEQKNNK